MAGAVYVGAALAQLILDCAGPPPPQVPLDLLRRIVLHETGGNCALTNLNKNGTTDYGCAQINSTNLPLLGETPQTIMIPCRNIHAEYEILSRGFSTYATGNGERGFSLSPPGQKVSYVESMADPKFRDRDAAATATPAPAPPSAPRLTLRAQITSIAVRP